MTPGAPAHGSTQERAMFRYDLARSVPFGYIEACTTTFLHLIALRALHAPRGAKALILTGQFIGMLLGPVVVHRSRTRGWRASRVAAAIALVGAAALAVAAAIRTVPTFVVCAMVGGAALNAGLPLITVGYQRNYPPARRGALASSSVMARTAAIAVSGVAVGALLRARLSMWPLVLVLGAVAFAAGAYCSARMPIGPLMARDDHSFLDAFRYLRTDRILRVTMASWMVMGVANLLFIPLRTEYLGNERYGTPLSALWITSVTLSIPAVMRVVCAPLYGRLFDRVSFFVMRMVVNIGIGVAIVGFLVGRHPVGLVASAVLYGMAISGGDILWNLWATRIAPPGRVADYMALHTFLTGVRGIGSPFLAFWMLRHLSVRGIGVVTMLLVLAGSAILLPEARRERREAALARSAAGAGAAAGARAVAR